MTAIRFGAFILYKTSNTQNGPALAQSLAQDIKHHVPSLPVGYGTYAHNGETKGLLVTGEHAAVREAHNRWKASTGNESITYDVLA